MFPLILSESAPTAATPSGPRSVRRHFKVPTARRRPRWLLDFEPTQPLGEDVAASIHSPVPEHAADETGSSNQLHAANGWRLIDIAFESAPVRFTQLELLQLTRRRSRQSVPELDRRRTLEPRKLGLAERPQFPLGHFRLGT